MPPGIDAMKAACTATGVKHHEEFAQLALLTAAGIDKEDEGGKGICFGLAAGWLDAMIAGKGDKYLTAVNRREDGNLLSRSALMWKNQLKDSVWLKLTKLKPAEDGSGDQKQKDFFADASNEEESITALVKWLGAAKSQRYFMIHVTRHAMAAVGTSGGDLYFFDPNGGIVQTKKPEKMVAFLNSYFSQPVIKKTYLGFLSRAPTKVGMTVCKYKS